MAHKPGNEYRLRIVREDGTQELSRWTESIDKVAQAIMLARKPHGATCWLLVRNLICPNCPDSQEILEYPIYGYPVSKMQPARLLLSSVWGDTQTVRLNPIS